MIERAERADDRPADFHRRPPHRRLRRAVCARQRGQARRVAGGLSMTRIALFQSRSGIDPAANAAALVDAIAQADGGRSRRCCSRRRCPACSIATPNGRPETSAARKTTACLAACRDAAQGARALAPSWLAGGAHRGAASSPTAAFVIDPTRESPSALRQDPSVRRRPCRPARAGARSAVYQPGERRGRRSTDTPVGNARPDHLLRSALSGPCSRGLPRPEPRPYRRPGRIHRSDRAGALGSAASGAGDRGRDFHRRGGAIRAP